jgi:hypothetical protein
MDNKSGYRKILLESAAKEADEKIRLGLMLAIMYLDSYDTLDYTPMSAIAYEIYKLKDEYEMD